MFSFSLNNERSEFVQHLTFGMTVNLQQHATLGTKRPELVSGRMHISHHKKFWVSTQHWCVSSSGVARMARGHQKIQSQQKNAKKQAELKKAKGHDQKTAAKAALVFTCLVCKVSMKAKERKRLLVSFFKFFFQDHYKINTCIVPSCSPRCPIQKPSSSTLKASTQSPLCPLS